MTRARKARVKSLGPSNDDPPAVALEMFAAEIFSASAGLLADVWDVSGGASFDDSDHLADAWAWDISRPLAEQLAETAADDAAASRVLAFDPDGAAIGWVTEPNRPLPPGCLDAIAADAPVALSDADRLALSAQAGEDEHDAERVRQGLSPIRSAVRRDGAP